MLVLRHWPSPRGRRCVEEGQQLVNVAVDDSERSRREDEGGRSGRVVAALVASVVVVDARYAFVSRQGNGGRESADFGIVFCMYRVCVLGIGRWGELDGVEKEDGVKEM